MDGEPVRLTAMEYKITELLMSHTGYVFSAEEISNKVWREDAHDLFKVNLEFPLAKISSETQ